MGNRRGGTLGISVYRSGKGVTGASPTVTGAQVVSPRATKRDSEFELLRFCCTTYAAAIANCLPVHSRYLLHITIRFVAGLARHGNEQRKDTEISRANRCCKFTADRPVISCPLPLCWAARMDRDIRWTCANSPRRTIAIRIPMETVTTRTAGPALGYGNA